MSGNTKDKIAVRNNAGKTTPAATAPMANDNANAIVPKPNIKKKPSRDFSPTGSATKRACDFSV
ncbi:hypothetical protein F2Q70_00012582 [Brassica cretica]|uniref:Uncharacterized protein n=1 Tax=Brassica cretica TaxID=69181 RepID=A0A8S9LSC8_BRACR|nr:hypothetical protein F2Q70_00012582 [Brassica cretica]